MSYDFKSKQKKLVSDLKAHGDQLRKEWKFLCKQLRIAERARDVRAIRKIDRQIDDIEHMMTQIEKITKFPPY